MDKCTLIPVPKIKVIQIGILPWAPSQTFNRDCASQVHSSGTTTKHFHLPGLLRAMEASLSSYLDRFCLCFLPLTGLLHWLQAGIKAQPMHISFHRGATESFVFYKMSRGGWSQQGLWGPTRVKTQQLPWACTKNLPGTSVSAASCTSSRFW